MLGLRVKADVFRPFDDLLKDDTFWRFYQDTLDKALAETAQGIILAGMYAGAQLVPAVKTKAQPLPGDLPVELTAEALDKLAEDAIKGYMSPFLRDVTQTTRDGIRDAVLRARRDGTGVEEVLRSIKQYFDPKRAEMIAVTETTRLFGIGSQAMYKAQGVTGWTWKTAQDRWVDPTCRQLVNKEFPIDEPFGPAHPRCRCFPAPVMLEGVAHPVPAWSGGMTRAEADAWSAGSAIPEDFYHFAKTGNVNGIVANGFRTSDGIFGEGVYTTSALDADNIGRINVDTRLTVRVNVRKPLEVRTGRGEGSFGQWMDDNALPDEEPADAIRRMGFDSMRLTRYRSFDTTPSDVWAIVLDKTQITVVQE